MKNNVIGIVKSHMMGDFQNNPSLQCHCCSAIRGLAINNPNNQDQMMNEGVLDLIKAAMINQPSHAFVQENACGALWSLATNNPTTKIR